MKNIFLNIMLCMISMLLLVACTQESDTRINTQNANDNTPLTTRGDCDDCPGDDECCCAVWLQPGATSATLQFCGTSNGLSACLGAATGNCPSFTGGGLFRDLDTDEPRKTFCVGENSPFYVRNLSATLTANIIITCQSDQTAPDTMWLQIAPSGFVYIETSNACVVTPCE